MPCRTWGIAGLAWLACAGCDDAPQARPRPMLQDPAETSAGPRYAVVSGDFSASSVSLIGPDLEVVADDYVSSGSTETGLVAALSGDVELPTDSGEEGVLVLIDRLRTDVITRVRLSDGHVLGQIKTHSPVDGEDDTAYSSNPQDYLRVAEDTAWVTRNEPNLDPDAEAIDLGNDLLRLDPSSNRRTEERIDLSPLDTTAVRTDPETGEREEVPIYARPSRMARAGDRLIVGLVRSSFDFTAFGSGMVAVVDLESHEVRGLELDGLQGCTHVSPVPDARDRVLVGCTGVFPDPRQAAGMAIVRVKDGEAQVGEVWRAREHEDMPLLAGSFVALGGDTVAAASNVFMPGGDPSVFGRLELDTVEFAELLSIPAGQGVFGTPLYDAETERLLVPDASVDADGRPTAGVRVLEREGERFEPGQTVQVARSTGMPARHVFGL